MGGKSIQPQATKSEVAAYKVVEYPGAKLPDTYHNMVYSKWLRSLRFGNEYFMLIDSDTYYKYYNKYIDFLLNGIDSVVRLAVLADDEDVVLGFSVSHRDVLDYVHVHKDYRKIGIATKLIPKDVSVFTHITRTWLSVWNNKYSSMKFNPFA